MEMVTGKGRPEFLRKLHRRLGVVFCVFVLMASGSGLLHNLMTRTQNPPPRALPTRALGLEAVRVPPQALGNIPDGAGPVTGLSIRSIDGQPWYQVVMSSKSPPAYVSAVDGRREDAMDGRYAAQIAADFLGGAPVRQTAYLTAFNGEYLNIFRLLPVYRFDCADGKGTRVYVSTVTGTVTRHTDNRRQWEANLFSGLHKFHFIGNKDVRDLILSVTTLGIFLTAAAGLALFFRRLR
ncbi:MAG: hypothetical protein SFY92_09965 [Verrucomicrobiae bacterium]|nr:hypothetical protein [Verrucomicrobiae bacterium]